MPKTEEVAAAIAAIRRQNTDYAQPARLRSSLRCCRWQRPLSSQIATPSGLSSVGEYRSG